MAYTTINKSSLHMNTKLYNGNGTTNTTISGIGMQPDWTWLKSRSAADSHMLIDIVRGTGKYLQSQNANVEANSGETVKSWNSDGFVLGNDGNVNDNGKTYVAWNWKAGGSQGSSNTAGSINTTYTSVNTTAGFSISSYTGTGSNATVGHGLGSGNIPKMIILKGRSSDEPWNVYHVTLGNTKKLTLQVPSSVATNTTWNNTTPTSSVFSIGSGGDSNGNNITYVAYCFAEKQGYSKFGSYTGNGNADGTFVYTGFKPAFIMIKRTDANASWDIRDNKRKPFSDGNAKKLFPDGDSAEISNSEVIEKLSNGFKIRTTGAENNANNGNYIYMAFAEAPLVGNNNVPCTAR